MISVIIPLFNKEKSVRDTINSVLKQSFPNFELIIINDGSFDKSIEVINQVKDCRIRIVSTENRGVSSARNRGVSESKYGLIALLDGDDLWDTFFLEEMVSLIQAYPYASLYGCAYSFQNLDSSIYSPDLGLESLSRGYIDYFKLAKNNTLFTSSSVIFRKDSFNEIGGFDNKLSKGEDIDLWIRFALKKRVAFYNKPLIIYKLDSENRSASRKDSKDNYLIWNLNKYEKYEKENQNFKDFLDQWRLAHINNFLTGNSHEVDEIYSLIKSIDLRKQSIIWKILKYTPRFLQSFVYKTWVEFKKIFQ